MTGLLFYYKGPQMLVSVKFFSYTYERRSTLIVVDSASLTRPIFLFLFANHIITYVTMLQQQQQQHTRLRNFGLQNKRDRSCNFEASAREFITLGKRKVKLKRKGNRIHRGKHSGSHPCLRHFHKESTAS